MGTGTDVAMMSADVTLVKGDLSGIVRARDAQSRHNAQHQTEPLLRFRLQLARRSDRCRCVVSVLRPPAEPHDRRRRNELQFRIRDRQRFAPAERADLVTRNNYFIPLPPAKPLRTEVTN